MRPSIIVIGTGFGGIAAAIALKQAGYDDLVLLEKESEVGGVWRDNTYPGAACDVPTPLYSYSFEPNPDWPRRFAPQPSILKYLIDVAEKYDVRRHVRFGSEVQSCVWNEKDRSWTVRLASGEELVADVVVPAVGQLSRPAFPAIDGRDSFQGATFHSARWDHDVHLTGKRVAVIGTGASAIQFVPEIQPLVESLTLFQRTPPFIVPRWDTAYDPRHRRLFRLIPLLQQTERTGWWVYFEIVTTGFLSAPRLADAITALSRRHMRQQTAARPGLFEKLWPDYPFGCKRGLLSDTYLPALTEHNVEVLTDPITAVEPHGVRTADGALHPADVLIYGTGFAATEFLAPMKITGRLGQSLSEAWTDGARAYYGLAVPGFPNMLIMYGPNTNTGGGSIIYFLETQARYIRDYVAHVASYGEVLDVKQEIEAEFDREIQNRLEDSVWTRCSSWYRNSSGRVTTNWPGISAEYRQRAQFRSADYDHGNGAACVDDGQNSSPWYDPHPRYDRLQSWLFNRGRTLGLFPGS